MVKSYITENQDSYLGNVETVFFFGAGASRHMTLPDGTPFPLDTDFINLLQNNKVWHDEMQLSKYIIKASIYVLKHLNEHSTDYMNSMEKSFCILDMLRMLGKYTGNKRNQWKDAVDAFKDLLVVVYSCESHSKNTDKNSYKFLIRRILQGNKAIIEDIFGIDTCLSNKDFNDLLYINKINDILDINKFAAITMNYDLGLEYAIHDFWGSLSIQKAVFLGDMYDYCLPNRYNPKLNTAFPILKLHGSCNWGYCHECHNVQWLWREDGAYDKPFDITRLVGNNRRTKCNHHAVDDELKPCYSPHIIPPTWNKWMGDYTMRHLWRQAHEMLSSEKCKNLVIVGTSLPATDLHLRYMLQMALKNNRSLRVLYVDPDADCKESNLMSALGKPVDTCINRIFDKDAINKIFLWLGKNNNH